MIVDVSPHEDFIRVGADLYMKKKISLLEALTGVKTTFIHLDGNITNIETSPGDIIGFNDRRILPALGLPFFGDSANYGNLVVEFTIEMPCRFSLTSDQILKLSQALPGQ
jgi:DnaJ family protein A protein 2